MYLRKFLTGFKGNRSKSQKKIFGSYEIIDFKEFKLEVYR